MVAEDYAELSERIQSLEELGYANLAQRLRELYGMA